jgi:putative membrane protein
MEVDMRIAALSLAACLVAGVAVAQPNAPQHAPPAGPNPPTTQPPNATVAPPNTTNEGHNPSVATTSNANDQVTPAKGSNSFSEGQAKSRIAERGYANVSDLKKDDDGVWRGTAEHSGRKTDVWLDYKGNVGETQ